MRGIGGGQSRAPERGGASVRQVGGPPRLPIGTDRNAGLPVRWDRVQRGNGAQRGNEQRRPRVPPEGRPRPSVGLRPGRGNPPEEAGWLPPSRRFVPIEWLGRIHENMSTIGYLRGFARFGRKRPAHEPVDGGVGTVSIPPRISSCLRNPRSPRTPSRPTIFSCSCRR